MPNHSPSSQEGELTLRAFACHIRTVRLLEVPCVV